MAEPHDTPSPAVYRGGLLGALRGRHRQLPPGSTIPPRTLLFWRERPDLQAAFDLQTQAGREQLVWWYLRHGFTEFGLRFEQPAGGNAGDTGLLALNRPVPNLPQHGFWPITWLMRGLADRSPVSRPQLRETAGQQQMLDWFFARGLMESNLGGFLQPDQAQALLADDSGTAGVPRLLVCLWAHDPDLATRFSGPADPAFAAWCAGEGARAFPILSHPLIALAPPPVRRSARLKPFGVNLFGHARGRSGISEDLRMAARVLAEAGIPFVIRDIPAGPAIPDEEQGSDAIAQDMPYAINLFTFTAATTVAAVIAMGGPAALADHHNIGFWPWELPEMPTMWRQAYDLVDEVWASSRFTYDSYCRSSPVMVRHMPFAVVAQDSAGRSRAQFDLPAEPFLFGFAFDGLSGFARKAPLATVQAFHDAFARDDQSVGLVIKGLRVGDDPAWRQVLAAIGDDPRIHLVTGSLDRGSLLDLWRALDCFVSLHRSEGFGRNIAETMLLGKPAIVTAHSGNMDFTVPGAAALVPCDLRPVAPGEYPFGAGQQWAEPDIAAAAGLMRRMAADRQWREGLAAEGQRTIADRYSPEAVGAVWRPVLQRIHEAA